MRIKFQSCLFSLLSLCLLCSCVHNTTSKEVIPLVTGTIDIKSVDKQRRALDGDTIYLIPSTSESDNFVETHDNYFYIPVDALHKLPGIVEATIGQGNTFRFTNVATGKYYLYWQASKNIATNPIKDGDTSLFSPFTLTAAKNTIVFNN
jgi:hypothetical protein